MAGFDGLMVILTIQRIFKLIMLMYRNITDSKDDYIYFDECVDYYNYRRLLNGK